MEFYSVDTLTGRIVGRLNPSKWSLTDPVRGVGPGSLTVPLPEAKLVPRLVDMTLQRRRWIAAAEPLPSGYKKWLWCGPITDEPAENGSQVEITVADWRTWFYRAPIRPDRTTGARASYIRVGAGAYDQSLILRDLMKRALDTNGAPAMVVDEPYQSGIKREITAQMLDRSIGEYMDDVSGRGGFDWYVYCTQPNPTHLQLHAAVCWPERAFALTTADVVDDAYFQTNPVKVEWRLGKGGNVSRYSWPGGQGASTRVWAIGQGEPPDQVYTSDEFPEIADGAEVAWETILGPLDGVNTTSTAFEHANAAITRARGYDRTVEFTLAAEKLPFTDCVTGQRARVVFYNGWVDVDIPAGRIVSRTMSGGNGEPTQQTLSIDLSDSIYPEYDPGEDVDDDQ